MPEFPLVFAVRPGIGQPDLDRYAIADANLTLIEVTSDQN
jgi:hypothetical protein